MSVKSNGPKAILQFTCFGCKYETASFYREQGDSGCDVYCTHPAMNNSHIGDTSWQTPDHCPLLKGTKAALIAKLKKELA